MRRLFLGSLAIAALLAGSNAFAVEAGSPSAALSAPSTPPGKQAAHPKPKQRPLPLSAVAREAARATELPAGSIRTGQPQPAPPTWTGSYIGVGVGAGVDIAR